MITDESRPDKPARDRSAELWLTVDVQRVRDAYRAGAHGIAQSLPDITHAALTRWGIEVAHVPVDNPPLRVDVHVRRAQHLRRACEHMARALEPVQGTLSMPASEMPAWLALEDGSTLLALLNPPG